LKALEQRGHQQPHATELDVRDHEQAKKQEARETARDKSKVGDKPTCGEGGSKPSDPE